MTLRSASPTACCVSLAVLCLLVAGCSSKDAPAAPPVPPTDAGADTSLDDPDAAPPPCTAAVNKGPWVVAIDATSAKVRWESCIKAPGAISWKPEAGGAAQTTTAVVTEAVVPLTFDAPLMNDADFAGTYEMNEVALSGLTASTCYTFSIAADATAQGRFCTARKPGDAFTFAAIGDTNPGLGVTAPMVASIYGKYRPDFTLHGGDIQYYSSGLETYQWWMQHMQPMLRTGAFYPSVGNHEDELSGEKKSYFDRFWGGAGFDGTNEYYRFESGGVWFFALDTELDESPASEQGTWLESKLLDAQKQPGFRFSVVFKHRPYVTCGDTGESSSARAAWASIFVKTGVKLVVQAHMHGYERFELEGLTYVTTAGGGGALGDVNANISRPECASRAASGKFYNATIFDVKPGQLVGTVVDDHGAVRDSFTEVVP